MQAVVLCGGLGTRLRTIVDDRPKSMALINNKPFLEILIYKLMQIGIKQVILSTGYKAESIEDYFSTGITGLEIKYSREPWPSGTAGAIKFCEPMLNEKFLVVNGDTFVDFSLEPLVSLFQKKAMMAMVLKTVQNSERYGTVELGSDQRIVRFVEKGVSQGGLINAGVYLFTKEIVGFIEPHKKVSLEQDVLPGLLEYGIYGAETDGRFIDIGVPEDYRRAQLILKDGVDAGL